MFLHEAHDAQKDATDGLAGRTESMSPRIDATTARPRAPSPPHPSRSATARFASLLTARAPQKSPAGPPLAPPAEAALSSPTAPTPRPRPHGRTDDRTPERAPRPAPPSADELARLDPLERSLWHARPLEFAAPPPSSSPPPLATPPLDQLVERLLRRVAIGNGRHRGVAHLEVGAGSLQGASITIHADQGTVRIEIDAPASPATDTWRRELERRLHERGLDAQVTLR